MPRPPKPWFWKTRKGWCATIWGYAQPATDLQGSRFVYNVALIVSDGLTDRNDLDDPLFGQFARCRELLRQEPIRHASLFPDQLNERAALLVNSRWPTRASPQRLSPVRTWACSFAV